MAIDRGDKDGKQRPANDNSPPNGTGADHKTDAAQRLDAVVLTIARLIGRQIARERFEALQAANDNKPPKSRGDAQEDCSEDNDDQ